MKESLPDPKALATLAKVESRPPKPHADDYLEVIEVLREDRHTWREIAQWLTKHGVELTHNQVYRAFREKWGDERAFWDDLAERAEAEAERRAEMFDPELEEERKLENHPDMIALREGYNPES